MKVIELLKKLYDILPPELNTDKFLKQFWESLYENSNEKSFFIGKIFLRPDLFQKLDEPLKNDNQFLVRNDDVLMGYMIYGVKTVLFTIKFKNNVYHFEIKVLIDDKMLIINAIKNRFMTRIETVIVKENNGCYDLFDCDIRYFDSEYKETTKEIPDIEREKDMIFAAQFAIPFNLARFFRVNYKDYKKELNANLTSYLMEMANKLNNPRDYLEFSSPFDLNYFENIENNNAISYIKNNLLTQIGYGTVVVSRILFDDLSSLIEDRVTITGLITQGYILKKEHKIFTLYFITINKGTLTIIKNEIKDSDAALLFNSNPSNLEVEGLENFFFDNRGLK